MKPGTHVLFFLLLSAGSFAQTLDVLIIDGRNNHDWKETTAALRATLTATGRFNVEIATAPESKTISGLRPPRSKDENAQARYQKTRTAIEAVQEPAITAFKTRWASWSPDFAKYDVVVSNYNGPDWPETMKQALVDYVKSGGGFVLVHAANNPFTHWPEFNDMIGLGWRKAGFGDCIKWLSKENRSYITCEDCNSGHGSKHAFQIAVREKDHPIMKGLPPLWMHGKDELYHNMRGPAKNLTVLSTAYSDPKTNGTGEHEPITWQVNYGLGRVIVTTMGHFWPLQENWDSLYCVGFQTVFSRSVEYAASGEVTLPIPASFPSSEQTSIAQPSMVDWKEPSPSQRKDTLVRKSENPYAKLSPEEQLHTFDLTSGYMAELVASEPQVEEPVLTVWDGNGAMYVAEMRSYMQDENGTGTKELRNGRVKRLVDSDGDGRMDQVSIFIDNLNLPRMILPLDGWIAVRESDTMDIFAYRDTNGDGIADEKKALFISGPRGRNNPDKSVEHQDSGLIWNLDNWIYITYNMERYRFTDQIWKAEPQPSHWTQWGLTHDDYGRLYWIDNSNPLKAVQTHPKYWRTVHRLASHSINGDPITLGAPYNPDFMMSTSLCLLNDRGGSASATRGFTSACGQSIFRGDRLPHDARGDYFFVDPTIHVVRRANITREYGKLMLEKAEKGNAEFLRTSDINSRFVNTATGPDGTLYITDMYRGIIQDAPWMNPQARAFTRESGLSRNIRNGRIWRIRHKDYLPDTPPRMWTESTPELVRHLQHPNGWWRDTAQRLILLRDDRKKVIPLLEAVLMYTQDPKARLHALWSLEGMGAITTEQLNVAINDRSPILRVAAIQILESDIANYLELLAPLAKDRDPRVAEQLILTLGTIDDIRTLPLIQSAALRHLGDRGVMMATTISLWGKKDVALYQAIKDGSAFAKLDESTRNRSAPDWHAALGNWDRGITFDDTVSKEDQRAIRSGETQYFQYCVSCHGADGKGMRVPGTDVLLAPSLIESKRVGGKPEHLVPVFINGLMGPIENVNYQAGFMAPAKALGITRDDRLAEILSYIRYAWNQKGTVITAEEVKRMRLLHEKRTTPWTDTELKALP